MSTCLPAVLGISFCFNGCCRWSPFSAPAFAVVLQCLLWLAGRLFVPVCMLCDVEGLKGMWCLGEKLLCGAQASS